MIAVCIFSANHRYVVDICTKHVCSHELTHWVAGGRDSVGVTAHNAFDSSLKPAFKHLQL